MKITYIATLNHKGTGLPEVRIESENLETLLEAMQAFGLSGIPDIIKLLEHLYINRAAYVAGQFSITIRIIEEDAK